MTGPAQQGQHRRSYQPISFHIRSILVLQAIYQKKAGFRQSPFFERIQPTSPFTQ
jgi:hypothetical protein